MRNPISTKVDFCNTFHAKCLFFQSQTPKFRPKNQQKKQPGNRYEQIFFSNQEKSKKLSKSVPRINKKSIKSKPGPHKVLPCALQCPRIVPGSSQGPPGRQSEATNHTKGQVCVPRMPRSPCNNAKNLQSQSIEQWSRAGGRGRGSRA